MSWSSPICPECSSAPTRFESAGSFGASGCFEVRWVCERCRARVLDLCLAGVAEPQPDGCLYCGALIGTSGVCGSCGVVQADIVARVRDAGNRLREKGWDR